MNSLIPDNLPGYKGNPNILGGQGFTLGWTKWQEEEIAKCIEDPVYFTKTYVKIVHVDKGLIPFEMWPFQEEMMDTFDANRFTICLCPRQVGKTTTTISYILHQILFRENLQVAILANKGSTARDILSRLRLAYEYLPKWLQQGVLTWNKGDIHLANGSKVIAAATSSDSIRGSTFGLILLDEFAHVPTNQADDFFNSVYPTISSGTTTKVIMVSTPKGMNHFYKMWTKSIQGKNSYVPFEVHWSKVPGRDQAWKEETIRNTSERQFQQEFECDFLGSSNTLISAVKLRSLTMLNPLRRIGDPKDEQGALDIFTEPVLPEIDAFGKKTSDGRLYALMVDVSRGQGLDFSAFVVIDVTEIPYRQVAKFKSNKIPLILYPTIIYNVAKFYNDAFVLIEISDAGQQIADTLHYDLEYENIIKIHIKGKQGQMISAGHVKKIQFGIKTSVATKRIGCANLKSLIENDKLIIVDEDTIIELTNFVAVKESFAADEGNHDDLAMCLVQFGWLVGQRYFKDSIKNDIRKNMQKQSMNLIDDDVLPFGIISDGISDSDDGEELIDAENKWMHEKFGKHPIDSKTYGEDAEPNEELLEQWELNRKKVAPLDSYQYDWLNKL